MTKVIIKKINLMVLLKNYYVLIWTNLNNFINHIYKIIDHTKIQKKVYRKFLKKLGVKNPFWQISQTSGKFVM